MTFNEFKELARPEGLPVQLKSLWYDGQGDWARAHAEVDQLSDKASAWVHAYLHRKEGDLWNADYWYSKAGKVRPQVSLEVEWESLVKQFLA
nr:hypothetical protein [Mucilaginibacter sp.]